MISIEELTKLNGQHLLLFGAIAMLPIPALGAMIVYFPASFLALDVFKITIIASIFGIASVTPAMAMFFA